ncbi:hypothetical protein BT67DRAFT_35086 [Trichocladium antarcticum]|uniref:Uncharacterized protein n=1 Tax=Trichocladium antarcticum TaxID=1450529 RepID=A0AAN6ULI4_9PEZI|nr:hypothetical protein BT67DRAFT_35086 [Trichocladium antarcticum]
MPIYKLQLREGSGQSGFEQNCMHSCNWRPKIILKLQVAEQRRPSMLRFRFDYLAYLASPETDLPTPWPKQPLIPIEMEHLEQSDLEFSNSQFMPAPLRLTRRSPSSSESSSEDAEDETPYQTPCLRHSARYLKILSLPQSTHHIRNTTSCLATLVTRFEMLDAIRTTKTRDPRKPATTAKTSMQHDPSLVDDVVSPSMCLPPRQIGRYTTLVWESGSVGAYQTSTAASGLPLGSITNHASHMQKKSIVRDEQNVAKSSQLTHRGDGSDSTED